MSVDIPYFLIVLLLKFYNFNKDFRYLCSEKKVGTLCFCNKKLIHLTLGF